jgi:hypothetical protein
MVPPKINIIEENLKKELKAAPSKRMATRTDPRARSNPP